MEKILKRNWLLALAAMVITCFALTACGSDDKNEPDYPDNPDDPTTASYAKLIVGEWEEVESYGINKVTFYSNGKGTWDVYSASSGNWTNDGVFSWKIKGDNVILDYGDGYIESYTIINLDQSNLIWQSWDDRNDEYDVRRYKRVK